MTAVTDRKRADRLHYRQPRANRVFGVSLVRLGIAEIDQNAVTHVFGDEAAETPDHVGHAFMVSGDHIAQVFRIHPRGQRRRPDEIAEHHRDLAALRGGRSARRGRRSCERGSGQLAEFGAALCAKARSCRVDVPAGRTG
jgi:hypothetical protein